MASNNSLSWWERLTSSVQGSSPGNSQNRHSSILPKPNRKCFVCLTGKTLESHKDIIAYLNVQEVSTVNESDFILVFCPVVSRAGTDIEKAVKMLETSSEMKPTVLVVLHHTFDTDCVVPDSSRAVNRKNVVTVDCLFHEDMGLLQCSKNNESLSTILKYIKSQDKEEFLKGKTTEQTKSSTELNKPANVVHKDSTALHEQDKQLNSKYPAIQNAQLCLKVLERQNVKKHEEVEEETERLGVLNKCLETAEKNLSERDAELMKTKEQLQSALLHIAEQNTQLENMHKVMNDMETQQKNTVKELQTCKRKLATQEHELQAQLKKVKRELENIKEELEEKERQLQNTVKESKQKLMEKDMIIQDKDKLLAEYTQKMQIIKETMKEKDTQFKQENRHKEKEKEEEEEVEQRGGESEHLPGEKCNLEDKQVKKIGDKSTHLKNDENIVKEKCTLSEDTEIDDMAEVENRSQLDNAEKMQEKSEIFRQQDTELSQDALGKSITDTKETEVENKKSESMMKANDVNLVDQEQEEMEQEQLDCDPASGTDN